MCEKNRFCWSKLSARKRGCQIWKLPIFRSVIHIFYPNTENSYVSASFHPSPITIQIFMSTTILLKNIDILLKQLSAQCNVFLTELIYNNDKWTNSQSHNTEKQIHYDINGINAFESTTTAVGASEKDIDLIK